MSGRAPASEGARESPSILERARALRPALMEAAPRAASERRLPTDVVDQLRDAGVFSMAMPRSWGGPELDVLDQLDVIEELAYADGSVGWCAMIGADSGYYSAFLDDEVGRALYPTLDLVSAGFTAPAGTAMRHGDGWRVSGRWSFGSGITHADRVVGGALLFDENGPLTDALGLPQWRTFFLPVSNIEIIDTWHTTGLEGSGSNDYAVSDASVADEHTFYPLGPTRRPGPLYRLSWWFLVKVAAVPLGIARRALDELVSLSSSKVLLPSFSHLRDNVQCQDAVARSEALVGSARAYLREAVAAAWDAAVGGDEPDERQRAVLRLAITNASTASRQAVQLLYDQAGTSAIYRNSFLDQALRDVTTAGQHLVFSARNYVPVGRRLLGLDPESFMI